MLQAVRARRPASPASIQRSPAATVRSPFRIGGTGMSYHSSSASAVHARVLSRWHRLQALGRPNCTVSAADGLPTVWLRIAFSSP